MKIGYSMLLQKYIEAKTIQYTDCKRYQIVCPSCYEPMFKVIRPSADEQDRSEYLSHYSSDKLHVTTCELRVKGLSSADMEKANALSREQSLDKFLAVLQEALEHYLYSSFFRGMPLLALVKAFAPSGFFQNRCAVAKSVWTGAKVPEILRSFDYFSRVVDESVNGLREGFSDESIQGCTELQKQIAHDMWKHVSSPKGSPSFNFLWDRAVFLEAAQSLAMTPHVKECDLLPVANDGSDLSFYIKAPTTSETRKLMMFLLSAIPYNELMPTISGQSKVLCDFCTLECLEHDDRSVPSRKVLDLFHLYHWARTNQTFSEFARCEIYRAGWLTLRGLQIDDQHSRYLTRRFTEARRSGYESLEWELIARP